MSPLRYCVLLAAALIACPGCIAPPREVQTLRGLVQKYPCTPAARFRGDVSGVELTPRERCALLGAARDAYHRSLNPQSPYFTRADTLNVLSAAISNDAPVAWVVEFRFLGSCTISRVRISQRDGESQVTSSSLVPCGSGASFQRRAALRIVAADGRGGHHNDRAVGVPTGSGLLPRRHVARS